MFTECSQNVHRMFTECSQNVGMLCLCRPWLNASVTSPRNSDSNVEGVIGKMNALSDILSSSIPRVRQVHQSFPSCESLHDTNFDAIAATPGILKLCLFASAIQTNYIVLGTTQAIWDFATDSFRSVPPLISLMLPGKINLSAFTTALASVLFNWASGMPPMQWPWHHRLGPTCHRHIHAGQPHRAISVCWVPFGCSFLLTGVSCLNLQINTSIYIYHQYIYIYHHILYYI